MSEETAEVFNAMRAARQDRHREWKRNNMAAIEESGLKFTATNDGESLLFRGNLAADFYPSTGRWRSRGKTYSGGAKKFIRWYVEGLHSAPGAPEEQKK